MTDKSRERKLFLAVLLVATVLASPLRGGAEVRTLDLVHAMSRGRLWIDFETRGATFDRAFVAKDPPVAFAAVGATPLPGTFAGHIYAGGPPGHALALLPAYVLLERLPDDVRALLLVILGAALPHALAAVAVRCAVERATACSLEVSCWTAAAYAFGTLALPYGTRLFDHTPALACLAGGLAVLLRRVEGRPRFALAGLLAANAVVFDFNFALPAASLFALAALVGGVRGALELALGALPPAVVLGAYQQACFGSPFETAYHHRADADVRALLAHGFMGFVAPSPAILAALLVGRRGLIATAPLALVGLVGLVSSARKGSAGSAPNAFVARFALVAALAVLVANSARRLDWHGGWAYGARYSIAVLPFALLGVPRGLELLGRRLARPVVALSVLFAWVGATVDWGYVESVLGNLRAFFILGPRARGIAAIGCGVRVASVTPATALVSSAAISIAFVVAHRLVRGGTRDRVAVVVLALAPWVASVPFHVRHALGGNARVREAFDRSYAAELSDAALANDDPKEAHLLVDAAAFTKDRELTLFALDRAVELDPSDSALRGKRDELAGELGRPRR